MSLKAKIEAVIYASEEPVTLAQLTGLLGHEAQAELDHIAAAQQSLTLEAAQDEAQAEAQVDLPPDQDDLNSEVLSTETAPEPVAPEAAGAAPVVTGQSAEQGTEGPLAENPEASDPSAEELEKQAAREEKARAT